MILLLLAILISARVVEPQCGRGGSLLHKNHTADELFVCGTLISHLTSCPLVLEVLRLRVASEVTERIRLFAKEFLNTPQ